ncbi:digestive organ expansion factor [Cantharellus anzutake]|uniref:digestive organ expansion factor n=1 Tax=Cantharellus anzutake TaxID=1750568 RepID=UPI001903A13E|nr:digestive organ expansion factor [Cantharellus anzutake]KAF8336261.1 digestive organ expansion factor [Cantharellus anzutake]
MDDWNDTRTKLLTLLNVSHLKSTKRKLEENPEAAESFEAPREQRVKLNQRRKVVLTDNGVEKPEGEEVGEGVGGPTTSQVEEAIEEADDQLNNAGDAGETIEDDCDPDVFDPFLLHFGAKPTHLSESSRKAVEGGLWKRNTLGPRKIPQYNSTHNAVEQVPLDDDSEGSPSEPSIPPASYKSFMHPRLYSAFDQLYQSSSKDTQPLLATMFDASVKSMDVQVSRVKVSQHESTRNFASLLALNHIIKCTDLISKHDEILAARSKASKPLGPDEEDEFRDQGFTRPSVLILLPFRNSAQAVVKHFAEHFRSMWSSESSKVRVQNFEKFISQFSLPEEATNKLAESAPGAFPADHVHTFVGNVDDNFKIGIKLSKKTMRLYEHFYGSHLIIASPLGLRLVIEEEGSDFLSSIDIAILDQVDTFTMQNWDHVKFVMSELNKIPKDSHDADFSRVKGWHLDGHAKHLRRTIMMTSYETPEIRSLFTSLQNVCGRVRTTHSWEGVKVPEGIEQSYVRFEASNAVDEPDKRLDYFTQKLVPAVLKSAVQSSGTVIFIPSYFGFVRVKNWLRENKHIKCVFVSEHTSNPDIQRARQEFASGKKDFLVVTERHQFFRRSRFKGTRNIIFYGPPDHPQFYSELLSWPFLERGVEGSDVTVKVLYSKYDAMQLERIVGTHAVAPLIRGENDL